MRRDIRPGAVFPDYELTDHNWGRPSVEDVRRDLQELFRKIRPDWDLSADGLREAWERGEKDPFFPYGERLRRSA